MSKMRPTTNAELPAASSKLSRLARTGLILAGMCLLVKGSDAIAFANHEWSLETKVEKSDAIVVGKVVDTQVHLVPVEVDGFKGLTAEDHTATVLVTSVIKGHLNKKITVDYAGPIPEDHPDCCVAGNSYVFFLQLTHDDTYMSINQRYGIYRIAPDSELSTGGADKP
jgi:hypothetical protein